MTHNSSRSSLRIGLVLDHFDPRHGGVEQWTYQFAMGLIARGHEVHVVAENFGPDLGGVTPHRWESTGGKWSGPWMARAEAAQRVLRTLSLDVIHDMGVGWYCDVLQPHCGSRMAAAEQNLLLAPPWLRPWKRRAARLLPRHREFENLAARQFAPGGPLVIALSGMVERHLQVHHSVEQMRLRRIYNGVNTERFAPRHRRTHRAVVRQRLGLRDETLFLIVAHNFRLKGVPTLLASMGELVARGRKVHLAVVGGKRVAPYERLAERVGCRKAVTFLGAVEDSLPFYAAADAYVQPTYYDPCSLVVLEALASGLPVVTTRFNGAAELMTEGHEGYIIPDPADPAALGERMEWLLDERQRRMMGAAARHLATQHSFDENIRRVLEVYDEAMEQRNREHVLGDWASAGTLAYAA